MIRILPYQSTWRDEFAALGSHLRQQLGELALRIDHIGSTAVPGLAAKDIIDIQITVAALSPALEAAMQRAGYRRIERITQDHLPPGQEDQLDEYRKWIFNQATASRRVNVHVRLPGRANQRYPLLFRDYLRAHPPIAAAYAQVKMALAKYHPEDNMEAYYDIKDPVCDIIMGGAEAWVAVTGWILEASDC